MWCFFVLQAEDVIRDAQESRGLGDVYKRQRLARERALHRLGGRTLEGVGAEHAAREPVGDALAGRPQARREGVVAPVGHLPVSYTHLTLPTIHSV